MRLLLLLLALRVASAQLPVNWTPIGPRQINGKTPIFESGKIQALAVFAGDSRVMYAGGGVGSGSEGPPAQAGVFKTVDDGAHWTSVNHGITDPLVNALWVDATNQNLVLAGTEVSGIFRSTDGGTTWSSIGAYGPVSEFVSANGKLLAAARTGIISSIDGGATWTQETQTAAPVRCLSAAGSVVAAGTDDGTVLWQSSPAGPYQSVYQAPGPPPTFIWSIAVNPTSTSTAYIVVGHGNQPAVLMTTANAGGSWSTIPNVGASPQAVAVTPSIGALFVAGADGLWTSTDGHNFHLLPFGRWDSRKIYWNDSQKVLYLGTDQGLHRSTDSGATFASLTGTLANSILTAIAVKGSNILVGVHDFDPMLSFDTGSTWAQPSYRSGGLPGGEDGPVALNGSYCYVDTAAGFQYSTDGCRTFHMTAAPQLRGVTWVRPGGVNAIAVAPSDPTQVFVATTQGVVKSTDSGVTMTPTPWPLSQATAIAVHPKDPKTILVGTVNGLSRTADGGATWTTVATAGAGFVTTLAFHPTNPNVVLAGMARGLARGGVAVMRSTDGGVTFQPSNSGLPTTAPTSPCCDWDVVSVRFSPDGLAALGTRQGAFLSADGGQTWQNITANSIPTYFSDFAWDSGYLYAATYGGGVIRTPLTPTALTATPQSLTFASGSAPQTVAITGTPAGASFTAAATTASGGPWLTVSPTSGTVPGSITVSVSAAGLTAGQYSGAITIASPSAVSPVVLPVQLTVSAAPPATTVVISDVVNGASYQPGISAGSWVTIRGTDLSQSKRTWTNDDFVNGQLPTMLDGVSATINGQPAVVYYISPAQLNVLAPANSGSGATPVIVKNSSGTSSAANATVAAVSPAFFLISVQAPAATHVDGSLIGPPDLFPGATTPAHPGETIVLYGTGFGASPDATTVSVTIGGVSAQVVFAGNISAGLCQINVVVPDIPDGSATLNATTAGVSTPAASLAVQR